MILSAFISPLSDVRGVTNRKTILEGYENVQAALLDYTLTCYPSVSVRDERSMRLRSINNLSCDLLGKVQQTAQYYTGNSFDGVPGRGAPVHEALRGQCAHPNATHGDAARQEEINPGGGWRREEEALICVRSMCFNNHLLCIKSVPSEIYHLQRSQEADERAAAAAVNPFKGA